MGTGYYHILNLSSVGQGVGQMPRKKKPVIVIDTFEKETEVAKHIIEEMGEDGFLIKSGSGYDPTADYIVLDRNGTAWGIERKSYLDCYSSIVKGRIYGQLTQLLEKYPDHAIFLLEAPTYFPRGLRARQTEIMFSVQSFFCERSFEMPCWYVYGQKASAHQIVKHAFNAHKRKIEGRGIRITHMENEK
jgi:ERCC4-type nuclease